MKSILGGGTYNDKDQGVKNQCWEQETSIPQAVWGVGRGNSHRRGREGEVNFRWQHLQRQSQRSRSHKRVLGKRMESQWSLNILVGVSSQADLFKAEIEKVIGWGLNQNAPGKG